jgi:hypothetical protein
MESGSIKRAIAGLATTSAVSTGWSNLTIRGGPGGRLQPGARRGTDDDRAPVRQRQPARPAAAMGGCVGPAPACGQCLGHLGDRPLAHGRRRVKAAGLKRVASHEPFLYIGTTGITEDTVEFDEQELGVDLFTMHDGILQKREVLERFQLAIRTVAADANRVVICGRDFMYYMLGILEVSWYEYVRQNERKPHQMS